MRRKCALLLITLFLCFTAKAVPAFPYPSEFTQPDGTTVTLLMHGDEWFNYSTTNDGYTVVKNAKGYYVYASEANGLLVPSTVIARNANERTAADKAFLSKVPTNLAPSLAAGIGKRNARAKEMNATKAPIINMNDFKGLVILVNYSDLKFSKEDPKTLFTNMICQKDYTGYDANIPYTGSVRDYYYDNSMGKFDPSFTVVGPIDVDHPAAYPEQTNTDSIPQLWYDVLAKADTTVDFSKYDTNGDGYVDMIFFLVAGYGSNYDTSSKYLWPHAWNLAPFKISFDGVKIGRYACSTEFYGTTAKHTIDGIGTICHEFSHVLGLVDEYDTNGATNGDSNDPGKWSLMSGGSYNHVSRTPIGYSIVERYMLGWLTPEVINDNNVYRAFPMDKSNAGYRINSAVDKEYFLLENRNYNSKWDLYIPGNGLLVWRVDSTNVNVWDRNTVNADTAHNYLELIRANQQTYQGHLYDSDYDTYPGYGNITKLDNDSVMPTIRSWTKAATPITLFNIQMDQDTVVFNSHKQVTTLADIEENGVDSLTYTVSDNLTGVYADTHQSNVLYAKDDNNSIDKSEPITGQTICDNVDDFDQSNWVKICLPAETKAANYVGKSITASTATGMYLRHRADSVGPVGPTLITTAPPTIGADSTYTPNDFTPSNFVIQEQNFFVTPKNLEYAKISKAVYMGDDIFAIMTDETSGGDTSSNIPGSFVANMKLFENGAPATADEVFTKGNAYTFPAIVSINKHPIKLAPKPVGSGELGDRYKGSVYVLQAGSIFTGVDNNVAKKTVKSVKYYNITGIESAKPFSGVNIIVKLYNDGTTSVTKQIITDNQINK